MAQIVAVDRRLERARDQEQSGAERLDSGTLVFHAAAGTAVALLLPTGFDACRPRPGRGRPPPPARRRAAASAGRGAGAGADAGGLARVDRKRRAPARLPARAGARRPGPRGGQRGARRVPADGLAAGAAAGADRRRFGPRATAGCWTPIVPEISDLARVARGEVSGFTMEGDPLGGVVADRRHRGGAVHAAADPGRRRGVRRGGDLAARGPRADRGRAGGADRSAGECRAATRPGARGATSAPPTRPPTGSPGLANRRKFDELIAQAEPRGPREGALVYADLDRFKLLNDTLGHPAGDAALIHFARIIQGQMRGRRHRRPDRGRGVRHLAAEGRPGGRQPDRRADPHQAGHHAVGLERAALAAQRVVRGGRLSGDRTGARGCCRPRRTRRCTWRRTRAEPGGAGGAVGRGGVRSEGRAEGWKCWPGSAALPPDPHFRSRHRLYLSHPGATGFDGFVEGMAACPGPESW